jgi:hypothetical protein
MRSPEAPPGASRERTGLAWQRSAFSFAALGGVVLGVAAHRNAPGLLALSAGLVGVAGAVWRHGRGAYERAGVAAQPRVLALLTAATTLAALAAGIAVLAPL